MRVGTCKISLRLPENDSLKGKRRITKSIASRLRDKFNVSVAEIDDLDRRKVITLGICCVSNNGRHANAMISNVVQYIFRLTSDLELLDYEVEILDGR